MGNRLPGIEGMGTDNHCVDGPLLGGISAIGSEKFFLDVSSRQALNKSSFVYTNSKPSYYQRHYPVKRHAKRLQQATQIIVHSSKRTSDSSM